MMRKNVIIAMVYCIIIVIGGISIRQLVLNGIITISIAVLVASVAGISFAVAFAVKHPDFGKALLAAIAAAWTVCAQVVKVVDMNWLAEFLNDFLFPLGVIFDEQVSLFVMFLLFFGVFLIVLYLPGIFGDSTAMGIHSKNGNPEFREKSFAEKNEDFCDVLRQRIELLHKETNWDEHLFVPIEAEVEVVSGNRRKRRYEDLLRCLKKTRRGNTVYLVLGDPGAGKSVSLRKLCLELLRESSRTGKTPVYINLKQWNRNWHTDRLPEIDDLIEFIEKQLRQNGSFLTDEFLDAYFKKMLEDGRWYFIFDSFDEMPCLMGEGNHHSLINHISRLIFELLTGPNQSGGVIASRLYKSPTEALGATVTLRIQEFNDVKIKTMLDKYLVNTKKIVEKLFGEKEYLVSICRNPFYLTLLINYIRENRAELPNNQIALYHSFIEGRLRRCKPKLEEEGVSPEELFYAAKRLAYFMQKSTEFGLECPASALYEQPEGRKKWRKWLMLLAYAKICRFGGVDETVSFVHRRFQEFFLVREMMEQEEEFAYQEIVTQQTGGLRDALVLYCEVAEDSVVQQIAEYCWKVVKDNIKYKTSILYNGGMVLSNTLSFMGEAFRNRLDAVSKFRKDFETFIIEHLDKTTDFAIQIAMINSMALFDQTYLQKIALRIFALDNRWLDDELMKNCRLISKMDRQTEIAFIHYFHRMPVRDFFRKYQNMSFSLSIPASFRTVRRVHTLTRLWYCSLFAIFLTIIIRLVISTWTYGIDNLYPCLFLKSSVVQAVDNISGSPYYASNPFSNSFFKTTSWAGNCFTMGYNKNSIFSSLQNELPGWLSWATLVIWELGWLILVDVIYHINTAFMIQRPAKGHIRVFLAFMVCTSGLLAVDILFLGKIHTIQPFLLGTHSYDIILYSSIPSPVYSKLPIIFRHNGPFFTFAQGSNSYVLALGSTTPILARTVLYALLLAFPLFIELYWLRLLSYPCSEHKRDNVVSAINNLFVFSLPLLYYCLVYQLPLVMQRLASLAMRSTFVLPVNVTTTDDSSLCLVTFFGGMSDEQINVFQKAGIWVYEEASPGELAYMDMMKYEKWKEILSKLPYEYQNAITHQSERIQRLNVILDLSYTVQKFLISIVTIVLLLAMLIGLCLIIRHIICWLRDRHLIRTQPTLCAISREQIDEIIIQLNTINWMRKFTENLVLNKVSLSGKWSEYGRPKDDSDMERNLAILDCESIADYNYRF